MNGFGLTNNSLGPGTDVDILLSYDTDIDFEFGDVMLTYDEDRIKRVVFKLLIAEKGSWKMQPQVGATPNTFIGEPNTRETGQLIQQYLEYNINEIITPDFVNVKVVPINTDSINIYIDIYADGVSTGYESYKLDFIYGLLYTSFDPRTDKLTSNETNKINDIDNVIKPNKYKDAYAKQQYLTSSYNNVRSTTDFTTSDRGDL